MSQLQTVAQSELIAGRYGVERALDEGGMGTVYAARDERLSAGFAPRILEYRTLTGPRHPDVMEVHGSVEVLEGGDLSRSAPLPWRTACAYLVLTLAAKS